MTDSGTAAAGSPGGTRSLAGAGGTAGLAAGGGLLVGGLLAVAFNLRAAITSLPPVFPELSSAAGYSTASLSVLAAVPVLSFAAFSGVAPALARRLGDERVIGLALVLLAAGLGLRSAAPGALLFPGTIVASCAIALMNVLLPSLVKRRRPDLAGLFIGLYMTSLTIGAVIAAAVAVPLFDAAGGGYAAVRLTLGIWAFPALLAALIWLPQLRFRTRRRRPPRAAAACSRWPGTGWPGRSPRSWACRACPTTRRCPGSRPCSGTTASAPERPGTCSPS